MTDYQLAVLWGEREVTRLLVEYCRRVDFGEASAIADLFTNDARWSGTELELVGQDAIREWFTRREGVSRRVSRHVITNLDITVSADTATCVSYLINYRHDRQEGDVTMPAPGEVPKYVGECRDEFRRTAEGWRFTKRHVDVTFVRRRPRAA